MSRCKGSPAKHRTNPHTGHGKSDYAHGMRGHSKVKSETGVVTCSRCNTVLSIDLFVQAKVKKDG